MINQKLNVAALMAATRRVMSCLVVVCAFVAFSVRAYAYGPERALAYTDQECEEVRTQEGYPEYYCDCLNHSLPFHYGMDTTIAGENWYVATLNQVSAGFSAYWFGNSTADVDGFISCGQDTATMSQWIGNNRAYHADLATLLNKIGAGALTALASIPLHVRVSQAEGTYGRLIVMPYEKGPHSTCDDPLPAVFGLSYVISDPDNVYALLPTTSISSKGQMLRWVCERGASAEVSIRRGGCNGSVVASHTFTDSTHVWILPYDELLSAKRAGDTLFFEVQTAARLGEMNFLRPIEIVHDTLDTVACLGTIVRVGDMQITRDTAFVDTTYAYRDTVRYIEGVQNPTYGYHILQARAYQFHFEAPTVEYDTINCYEDELGFEYLGMRTQRITAFGDYSIYYRRLGECDRDIRLHVEEILYPIELTVDTTLCQGKRIRLDGVNYTRDTVFTHSQWQGKQETVTTYRLHFTAPEVVMDTVYKYADELPFYYGGVQTSARRVTAFGTKTLTLTATDQCTEKVKLTTVQLWYNDTVARDTTICQGKRLALKNTVYTSDTLVRTMTSDASTHHYVNWAVSYARPDTVVDSLLLHVSRMPYDYYGTRLTRFGDTLVFVTQAGECDKYVRVHTEEYVHPIDTAYATVDTTFCEGKRFVLHGAEYTETAQFVDTFWVNEYSVLFTTCQLSVVPMEVSYDTVRLLASSLPYSYENMQYAAFGSYEIEQHNEGDCDRKIYLTLEEKHIVYDTLRIDTTLCVGKVLIVADTFATTNAFFTRTYWSPMLDSCHTTTYNVQFEPQPTLCDTVLLHYSDMPYRYDGFPGGTTTITSFGEHTRKHTPAGQCTDFYSLRLIQVWDQDTIVRNDTICAGGAEQHSTEWQPADKSKTDSLHLIIYNIYVAEPEVLYDTIRVSTDSVPAQYQGHALSAAQTDYELRFADASGCTVVCHLHLDLHDPIVDPNKDGDALEDVTVGLPGVRKFIIDGHLYIEQNGVVYDAMGRKQADWNENK